MTVMQKKEHDPTAHLSAEDVERLGRELDELRDAGSAPRPGSIPDSNGPSLAALARRATLLAALAAFYSVRLAWQSRAFNDISTGNDATPLWIPQLAMAIGTLILFVAFVDEFVDRYGDADHALKLGRFAASGLELVDRPLDQIHERHPCTIGSSVPPLSNASPRTFFWSCTTA